jgi:hypothetical protein
MSESRIVRERLAWIALVAALATSASWLALITAGLLMTAAGTHIPETLVAVRALFRVAWLLLRQVGALTPLILLVPALVALFVRSLTNGPSLKREARHA